MIRILGTFLLLASGAFIVWKLIQEGRDRNARRRYIPGEIQAPEMQWLSPDTIDWNSAKNILVYARQSHRESDTSEIERSSYIAGTVSGISWNKDGMNPAEIRLTNFQGEFKVEFEKIETAMLLE